MLDKIKKTMLQYDMLSSGDSILIGLSGGPDSVCMLYILKKLGLKLSIAHLNHGLRGKESDMDQKFCEEIGKKMDIPVFTKKVKIRKGEDAARKARYKFLEETAEKIGAKKIALGHNADDQVETVLMRLLRGAGARGLAGIPPVRRIGRALIVRPLINVWREEILDFLKKKNIAYKEDSTNKELIFFRNKIRHELIPFLSGYNPNIKNILQSTGRNMAMLDEFLEDITEKEIRNNRVEIKRLRKLHPIIRQEVVRRVVRNIEPGLVLTSTQVENILALAGDLKGSKRVDLPKGISVIREYNYLIFSNRKDAKKTFQVEMSVPGSIKIKNCNIFIISKLCNINEKIVKNPFEVIMDYDKITRPLIIRNRKPGDVFQPIGLKGKKKVKDIFIDKKIPERFRDSIPIFISGRDICWIPGYRIGEKFKIASETKRILKIKVDYIKPYENKI